MYMTGRATVRGRKGSGGEVNSRGRRAAALLLAALAAVPIVRFSVGLDGRLCYGCTGGALACLLIVALDGAHSAPPGGQLALDR
jgi:hypothetical protein